jgi:MFS family permease
VAITLSPETRERPNPLPSYRPQRVSVPRDAVARYLAGGIGAAISFAVFGLFTSLAPSFLAGTLHHRSHALAGATAFAVFAAAVVAQTAIAGRSTRTAIAAGIATMVLGMAVLVVAVFLPAPSLALFLIGGVFTGAGAGALFRGVVSSVAEIAPPQRRAEALAGIFLAGYIGLSVPVLGLGVMTQYLSARVSLVIFTGVLALAILAATPRLLQRSRA